MKFSLHSHNQQRGEVAWLLTVVSMIVIGAGLVIGFNISTQEQAALRTSPLAQTEQPTPAPRKKLLTEPSASDPAICFPFSKDSTGKTNRVSDPFCKARLTPLRFIETQLGRGSLFNQDDMQFMGNMLATDIAKPTAERNNVRTDNNPFIKVIPPSADLSSIANPDEASQSPVPFTFYGGLCFLQNEWGGTQSSQEFESTMTVYLSPFYVRKYEYEGTESTKSGDPNDIRIVRANGIFTGDNGENVRVTVGNRPADNPTIAHNICNYKSGAGVSATLNNTYRYPLLFKINFQLSELKQVIHKPRGIQEGDDVQKFDTNECSMYLHARSREGSGGVGDVYNIAKIHLKDIVGQEAADALCPVTTPEPPTPTPSDDTPPPPSVTPTLLSCSASCTTSAQCGTYADPEQGGSQQPLICASTREFVDLCENTGGVGCTCVPEKCLGPSNLCTFQQRSCGTNQRISPTPTIDPPEITTEPQELTCNYNALAFVEECTQIDPRTGACTQRGNRANAKAFTTTVLGTSDSPRPYVWGTTNNRQASNELRRAQEIPATAFDVFTDSSNLINLINRYRGFQMSNTEPLSGIDVSSSQKVATTTKDTILGIKELLRPRSDIKIEHVSELPENSPTYTNEQYTNFSDAVVELEYDEEAYSILPNGKRVYTCTNELAAQLAELDPNDPQAVLARKACTDETDEQKKELNRIYGLKVGCGQNIVYGWTLQKCTFDYDLVFVIDTSLTMNELDPTSPVQQTKLQRVQAEVKNFIDHARTQFGPQTRVGIVSFNAATVPYAQANASSDGGTGIRTPNMVSIANDADVNNLKALVDGLQAREGTCIQCGLRNAKTLISGRSNPDERTPVVILLSDGLVNAYPGASATNPVLGVTDPNPGGSQEVYTVADELRADDTSTSVATGIRTYGPNTDTSDDVLLITLGYGDTSIKVEQGQDFDTMIKMLASNRRDASRRIIDEEKWTYTTDRKASESSVDFAEIVGRVKSDLNSCTKVGLAYENFQKAKDVNGDGIINVIDLFTVFDNYFAKGENLKEDINADGVVNVNDITLIIESLGTVITPADSNASGSANAAPINEEFQSGFTQEQ